MTRLFEYTISKCGSQKGDKEELYGTPTKLFMGVQATDGATAGERRAKPFPDQPGSSCDAQFVVRMFDVCSIAGGLCVSGLHLGRLLAQKYRLEPLSSHRCTAT